MFSRADAVLTLYIFVFSTTHMTLLSVSVLDDRADAVLTIPMRVLCAGDLGPVHCGVPSHGTVHLHPHLVSIGSVWVACHSQCLPWYHNHSSPSSSGECNVSVGCLPRSVPQRLPWYHSSPSSSGECRVSVGCLPLSASHGTITIHLHPHLMSVMSVWVACHSQCLPWYHNHSSPSSSGECNVSVGCLPRSVPQCLPWYHSSPSSSGECNVSVGCLPLSVPPMVPFISILIWGV